VQVETLSLWVLFLGFSFPGKSGSEGQYKMLYVRFELL
jgi:hypothetical protein